MCGIAGLFYRENQPVDSGVLSRMTQRLAHRGPDDEGMEQGKFWGLGHRRLSILGLSTGHQPMTNEDRSIWVAFNGEIYNHLDLRCDLAAAGHPFRTQSDTEVLIHGYEEYGIAGLLPKLAGMFAFALVDKARHRLVLARDRLGQKPLYYHATGGFLAFASELGALLEVPDMPREIDRVALHEYLSFLCIPAPRSIYRAIRKLPPATFLEFSPDAPLDQAEPQRYWQSAFTPKLDLSYTDACHQTRALLERAVTRRLQAEVPLGAFLSGGIDSTAVAGLMRQITGDSIHTFTIGFEDPRYDEREYARMAAEHLGTTHHSRLANPQDVGLLRQLIRHHGEPYCDSSMIATALLSRFTRESVTVALSGDAGDELFGGYQRYQVMALDRLLRPVPAPLRRAFCQSLLKVLPQRRESRTRLSTIRRLLEIFSHTGVQAYGVIQQVFSDPLKTEIYGNLPESPLPAGLHFLEETMRRGTAADAVEAFMELDLLTYLPADILPKVDIASMSFALEARSPFLDHELVEFVSLLPRRYKVTMRKRKRLLLDAVADLLPPAIQRRGKLGFGVPISSWLRQDLRPMLEHLRGDHWNVDGIFDSTAVNRLIDRHLSGAEDLGGPLWALLCFSIWVEEVHSPRR